MFLRADGWVVKVELTSLSLLEFLDSQENGLVSLLPTGAGAGVGAAAGGATVGVAVEAVGMGGKLLSGDEGCAAAVVLFREVVLLNWSLSEGLAGSAEAISNM